MQVTPKKVLFLSDLDGTWLSKNPANRKALDEGVQELRDEFRSKGVDLEFGYVTARPPERVAQENLPNPNWTITFNGGRIDQGSGFVKSLDGTANKTEAWQNWNDLNESSHFAAPSAMVAAQKLIATPEFGNLEAKTIGDVVENLAADDCKYAAHLCFDLGKVQLTEAEQADLNDNNVPDIFEAETFQAPAQLKALSEALNKELKSGGAQYEISPLYLFHGKPYAMVDVATPIANKGSAVDYLRRHQGVDADNLIIAGDGGNDISMMRDPSGRDDGRRVIIVGPDAGLRQAGSGLEHALIQAPEEDCSLGVLSGLRSHLEAIITK